MNTYFNAALVIHQQRGQIAKAVKLPAQRGKYNFDRMAQPNTNVEPEQPDPPSVTTPALADPRQNFERLFLFKE